MFLSCHLYTLQCKILLLRFYVFGATIFYLRIVLVKKKKHHKNTTGPVVYITQNVCDTTHVESLPLPQLPALMALYWYAALVFLLASMHTSLTRQGASKTICHDFIPC